MTIPLALDSDIVDVHYDADNAWLYWDWSGAQTTTKVQAACRLLLPLVAETSARKLLINHSRVTEVSQGLDAWVVKQYLPELGRAGIEHIAWVCCPVLSLRDRTEVAFSGTVYRPRLAIFDDIAAAYTWLADTPFITTAPYPLAAAAH